MQKIIFDAHVEELTMRQSTPISCTIYTVFLNLLASIPLHRLEMLDRTLR